MSVSHAIILSQDLEIITLSKCIADEMGMKIVIKPDLSNFLLELQDNRNPDVASMAKQVFESKVSTNEIVVNGERLDAADSYGSFATCSGRAR